MVRAAFVIFSPGMMSSILISHCSVASLSLILDWDSRMSSALDLCGLMSAERVLCLVVAVVDGSECLEVNFLAADAVFAGGLGIYGF